MRKDNNKYGSLQILYIKKAGFFLGIDREGRLDINDKSPQSLGLRGFFEGWGVGLEPTTFRTTI